jgi:hypothetical protein
MNLRARDGPLASTSSFVILSEDAQSCGCILQECQDLIGAVY